jgi:hypothetical protein
MATLIRLNKELFKDEASYQEFVETFREALSGENLPMVLPSDTDDVLFAAISPELTKKVLCDKILQRLGENPSLMDELRDRLENDKIVD